MTAAQPAGAVIVLGATGYTGRLAAQALLRRGARPIIAGRHAALLAAVSEQLGGLECRTADISDAATIRALVRPGDVLITTVGPFERFGHVAAEAAATVGAHYLDSTGEVGFVRDLMRGYDQIAHRTGAAMLPAFGYDYVPGILAGALALRDSPNATGLQIGYFATGSLRNGLSQGTRTTMAGGLTLPCAVWRDGVLSEVRTASAVQTFRVRDRRKTGLLVSGTEVLALPAHYPHLTSVRVFNGWFPTLSRAATAASALANLIARRPSGQRLVDRIGQLAAGPAGGPDEAERARTRTHVVARATATDGQELATVHLEGPSIYTLTGELLASAAADLARGTVTRAGVLSPLDAFDLESLEARCADIGLQRTPQ